jgi:hypothetical protein
MPQFAGPVFLPDGSLLAPGVQGEYDLDDTEGRMAYSGRFTIPAARSGPLAHDPDPLWLRVDSGPAIRFRMTRMQSGSGRAEATVDLVSNDEPIDDRTAQAVSQAPARSAMFRAGEGPGGSKPAAARQR